jgi:NADPH-dependent glutamate synthase beta subunit-like oxidoreductase
VVLYDCHASDAIVSDGDRVTALQVHRIRAFHFDAETKALVEECIPDSTYELHCDAVVFAMGQGTGLNEEFVLRSID